MFSPQNTQENAMKRSRPQHPRIVNAHNAGNTLLHLARRLVRKSQSQDRPRLITLLHQISNLISQHPRLARPRTCYHKRRTLTILHCHPLGGVKSIQIILQLSLSLYSLFLNTDTFGIFTYLPFTMHFITCSPTALSSIVLSSPNFHSTSCASSPLPLT